MEGGKPGNPEKNPANSTHISLGRNRTRATLVGGKRSRPCAISAPQPMASAVPVAFWLVLPVKEGRILYGLQIFNKISILQNLDLGYILKIFLTFLKFEP